MIKQRYWVFLMYPESMPEDAFERLRGLMLPMAISPLHDKDVEFDSGELKKAHYHVLLCYPGPTTYKAVLDNVCSLVNGTVPKVALYLKSAYEYLWHKNDPDKYQYSPDDVTHFHGLSLKEIDKLDFQHHCFTEILDLIKVNHITTFKSLVDIVVLSNNLDLMNHLMTYCYFWKSYVADCSPSPR